MPATPSFLCLRDHRTERPKPGAVTFTPHLAKRASTHLDGGLVGDVFATGIKIQGEPGSGKHDTLTVPRGTAINTPYHKHVDPNQGTLVLWVRPDWPGDDGQTHIILHDALTGLSIRKTSGDNLTLYANSLPRAAVDISGWDIGTKHLIIIRWDAADPIDATHHACITVGTPQGLTHTFTGGAGGTLPWTPNTPAENIHIGSTELGGLGHPWNGLIEGLTLYRRVLYDGTHGTDAGNGDELDQLYNSGDFAKPIPITGREDVVLYLPTDETPGTLNSGTGEAYTFPHDNNLITGTPAAEGGTTITETDDPIYHQTAYQITDVDAVGDGAKATYDCSGDPAGQNYLAPIWIQDDGSNPVTLRIHDATNNADITTVDTTGSGAWEHLAPNFDRPAGCNTIEITIEATDAGSGTITTLPPQLYTATTGTVAWDDVTLTATPATQANSMRSGDLRIDGRDTCTQPTHLLTPTSGDLRLHAQLQTDLTNPTAMYRWIYTVYDTTTPGADNRLRLGGLPIPFVSCSNTFDGDDYEENSIDPLDTQRHAYRIRWTPNEIAVWIDHQLWKRWTGDAMAADWQPQISWGHDGDTGQDEQLDGWIGP